MTRKLNILVAEDNADDFFFLQRVLKKAGVAALFHAADGKSAVDFMAGEGPFADRSLFPFPDVLLLDLKLPILSGHDVLEWLRRQSNIRQPRVYILSASAVDADRSRAEEAGVDGYFLKPISLGHLSVLLGAK